MQADDSNNTPTGDTRRIPLLPSTGAAAFIFQGTALRYANAGLEMLTGYSVAELREMDFSKVIHPDDRALVLYRNQARQRGEAVPAQYQVKLLRKSGEPVWVSLNACMIELDGQPAVLGTAVDITDAKAVAARLYENERRLRALIEHSSDAVLIVGEDLRVNYVGPSMERILGFRPEEMVGYDNLDRIHVEDQERVRAAYAELLQGPGRRASATYRIRRRDGSWRWFESVGTNMLNDPCVAGIIVNSRDITDRVAAEAAYRDLVERSPHGLGIVQDGRVVFVNPAAVAMTGYSAEELMRFGLNPERDIVHADDAQAVWRKWQRRTSGEFPPPRTQFRVMHKDGTVRWLETYVIDVEYQGRPALQVSYSDITDRKRAEEDARLRQQELAHVLRRRTMGEMAAVFAHEVNQPLSAIISYAKGCAHRLRTGSGSPEPLLVALDEIGSQAVRAGEIIRRLRRFVRKGELQRQLVQVNELVEEVIQFVTSEAQEHRVRVQLELGTDLPSLEMDAVQIEQVILNLLRNALESMYEDPGDQPCLLVRTRRTGSEIEVSVSDTGAGLRLDVAADIFEPFVTSKPNGLGMGLSICRSIVDAHGGRVWSTPNQERGMTFHFALPLPPVNQQRVSM